MGRPKGSKNKTKVVAVATPNTPIKPKVDCLLCKSFYKEGDLAECVDECPEFWEPIQGVIVKEGVEYPCKKFKSK